jgi:putative glutamine amidotransferase
MDQRDDNGLTHISLRWVRALQNQGLAVHAIDPQATDRRDILDALNRADAVFLPGGNTNVHPSRYGKQPISPAEIFGEGCVPKFQFSDARDHVSKIMVEHALETKKPLLAVCRGMQELNVALRGTLQQKIDHHDYGYRDGNDWRDLVHAIRVVPETPLHNSFGRASVMQTSIHRQGMYVEDVSSVLKIAAMADDGKVVEAIYHPDHPFMMGVQFHAELHENQPLNENVFSDFSDFAYAQAGLIKGYNLAGQQVQLASIAAE